MSNINDEQLEKQVVYIYKAEFNEDSGEWEFSIRENLYTENNGDYTAVYKSGFHQHVEWLRKGSFGKVFGNNSCLEIDMLERDDAKAFKLFNAQIQKDLKKLHAKMEEALRTHQILKVRLANALGKIERGTEFK